MDTKELIEGKVATVPAAAVAVEQERAISEVEIKTARYGKGWGEPGTDAIPDYYALQVHHYMTITGYGPGVGGVFGSWRWDAGGCGES